MSTQRSSFLRAFCVVGAACALFIGQSLPASAQTVAQLQQEIVILQSQVGSLQNTVAALQAKTAPISVANGVGTNTELYFTGVNVHVVNGLGATDGNPSDPIWGVFPVTQTTVNGLGNLIIGYNESRSGVGETDTRTGSHNLVLGDLNNYSSFGGIVGGWLNSASGGYASVLDGASNSASGLFAAVVAGGGGTASGEESVVVSGGTNTASGIAAAVTGGQNNTASSEYSVSP